MLGFEALKQAPSIVSYDTAWPLLVCVFFLQTAGRKAIGILLKSLRMPCSRYCVRIAGYHGQKFSLDHKLLSECLHTFTFVHIACAHTHSLVIRNWNSYDALWRQERNGWNLYVELTIVTLNTMDSLSFTFCFFLIGFLACAHKRAHTTTLLAFSVYLLRVFICLLWSKINECP